MLLIGCRSPFSTLGPETGPPEDPERIGTAIHGWPMLETAWHGTTHRTDLLWPLATVRESSSGPPPQPDTVLPLFVHATSPQGRRWGLRPLFDIEDRAEDGRAIEDVDLLFPIVKWRTEPDSSLFELRPILWSKRSEDLSRLVVFPLYAHTESDAGETTFVFPSYLQRTRPGESLLHVWPLWSRKTERAWTKDWTLFPFFGWGRDSDPDRPRWEVDAPAPLVHFGRDGETTRARVLPLLWHERGPDDGATVLFPFWWSIHDADSEFDMLFPFHASWKSGTDTGGEAWLLNAWIRHRSGDETTTHLLAPLVRWSDAPDHWSAHLWPLVWLSGSPDHSTAHVWPLFGRERTGTHTTLSTAWPFFQFGWDENSWRIQAPFPLVAFAGAPDRSEARVWPLFLTERQGARTGGNVLLFLSNWETTDAGRPEEASEFRVLWKLVESTSKGGRSAFAINPLFRTETNARGDVHWSCLFGLLARTRQGDEVDWRVLWFL